MKTTSRTAIDPATNQSYQIDFPALEEIRSAILNLDHPSEGIKIRETVEKLVVHFNLSDEQKNAKTKNKEGYQNIFYYMVSDAIINLAKKGKMRQPGKKPGKKGTPYFLVQEGEQEEVVSTVDKIEDFCQKVHKELADELLYHIKSKKPAFFEELVIDLLVAMGYGGSREDAEAVERSGDGGIDGIIKEDRLGLDVIYVQAKREKTNVGEPPVRDFVGALQKKRARKGIFITTSNFAKRATDYASKIDSTDSKVVLIDGQQLAQLMIEHNVGVSTKETFEIKRVDSNYFAETE